MAALARARPDDAVLSEEGADDPVAADAPSGCGSSTRSTAPASSPNSAATTGPCTSRCGSAVNWSPVRWRYRRRASRWPRPTVAAPPAAPGAPRDRGVAHPSAGGRAAGAGRARRRPGRDGLGRSQGGRRWCRAVADVYVHAGGQYEWDSAAPVAVARAAGLHTSRIDGSPLQLQPGRPAAARPAGVPSRATPTRCWRSRGRTRDFLRKSRSTRSGPWSSEVGTRWGPATAMQSTFM